MNESTHNPLLRPDDDPDWQVIHAVVDLAITMRGAQPNTDLGDTDMFLVVGEWSLAFEEMETIIDEQGGAANSWVQESFDRAQDLLNRKGKL